MTTCLERLKSYLAQNQVTYEILPHREEFTSPGMAAAVHESGARVAKVFIAWIDGGLHMLVLPAHAHVDLERVKDMLKADFARQAREEEFESVFPDCEVGAMPPFGSLYDVPVHLDHSLARVPYLVFEAGSHRTAMKIPTSDYLRLVLPTIGDFTQQPQAEEAEA